MQKINVMLYGSFGRNAITKKKERMIAEILYCDRCQECDFYQKGQCLNYARKAVCHYGRSDVKNGYFERKNGFFYQYYSDELFCNLKTFDKEQRFAFIGDDIYINLETFFLRAVSEDESRHQTIRSESGTVYAIVEKDFPFLYGNMIPKADMTFSFLNQLLSYQMHHQMIEEENENKTNFFQKKIVPEIIRQIKELHFEFYQQFIEEYPQWKAEENI